MKAITACSAALAHGTNGAKMNAEGTPSAGCSEARVTDGTRKRTPRSSKCDRARVERDPLDGGTKTNAPVVAWIRTRWQEISCAITQTMHPRKQRRHFPLDIREWLTRARGSYLRQLSQSFMFSPLFSLFGGRTKD